VTEKVFYHPETREKFVAALLASLAVVIAGWQWSLIGWLHFFFPLMAFFYVGKFGVSGGIKILAIAIVVGGSINFLTGDFFLPFFSASMLVPGFILYESAERKNAPATSGFYASLALATGWLLIGLIVSIQLEASFYEQLLKMFNQTLSEALEYYRKSNDIYADALIIIENYIAQLQAIIPLILPSIIGSIILFVIWFTMILGNSFSAKVTGSVAWPPIQLWSLSDKLIWLAIAMGLLTLLQQEALSKVTINILILLGVIYSFQGVSITVFLLSKWKVPKFFRFVFYIMLFFQSFGTVLLIAVGVADTWIDFRKLKTVATINFKS
jgi:hypothetical protein